MSSGTDGASVEKRDKPEIVCVLQITKKRRIENDTDCSTPCPSVPLPDVRDPSPVRQETFTPVDEQIQRRPYVESELRVSVICERLDMTKVNQKVPLRNDCKLNEKKNGAKAAVEEKNEEPKCDHNYSLPASEKNGKNKSKTNSK